MKIKEYTISDKSIFAHLKFTPPHKAQNSFSDELRIVYVIKGFSTYYTPYGSTYLKPGDLIMFNKDNFINTWKDKTNTCEIIIFKITPTLLTKIYKQVELKIIRHQNTSPFLVFSLDIIYHFFEGFKKYLNDAVYLNEELYLLKLQELMYILSKQENFIAFIDQMQFQSVKNNSKLRNTVFSNLYHPINIEELAFLCNMSLSTFQRKFKEIYHTSPTKHIEKQRMDKAKLLLIEPKKSIAEIAESLGYISLSHFSKVFKKTFHISPNTYRKTEKKKSYKSINF